MTWHNKKWVEVIDTLKSNEEYGLSYKQVKEVQAQYGKNKLSEKKRTSIIVRFFMQFNDFMIFILLLAAVVSFIVSFVQGEYDFLDPIIILIIVSLNAILGLVQENKAEKSLEALKNMSAPQAKVIRSGQVEEISTEELVPGDIILLESGDYVPADARLISSFNLKIEESALTGESIAIEKDPNVIVAENATIGDRFNMVFSGTSVSYGRAKAIVTATGMDTQMGHIADLILKDDSPDTPLQKKLENTGKLLGILAIIICIVIFLMGIFRGVSVFTMFMTSVSLAVAAIPEGLPAIVTIMLAIGVQRMAKRKAVIRKLPAVETLGSANIICSDKTGTLTQNKMKVVEVCSTNEVLGFDDPQKALILTYGSLCNDTILQYIDGDVTTQGDPTETAMVLAAYQQKIIKTVIDKEYKRIGEIPFDSKRKLMSTVHEKDKEYIVITKGAPDVLLHKCTHYYDKGKVVPLTAGSKKDITLQNEKMANKALRVLGVAYKIEGKKPISFGIDTIESGLVFLGLVGIIDPPREEVKGAVKTCKEAGIRPVMITGDHVITAKAIALKIGIMEKDGRAITGQELSKLDQDELSQIIEDYSVFARVSPEHKVRIVKAFQKRGNIVAMTGDGVNDAPALKSADIGCAMGITGTDVAKGAADMVLLDDNFATIVEAVREGRGIYSNIKKAIHFLLSSNVGEIITIFLALLLGWSTPLLAIHLLWVNLVTDSLPAIALGLDPADEDVMKRKPYSAKNNFFSDGLWLRIAIEGCMIGLLSIIAFGIGTVYFDTAGSYIVGRTMAFATLSISQLVHAFNVRTEKSIFTTNIFQNIYLIGAFFIGVILQIIVISLPNLSNAFRVVPLQINQWCIVFILSLVPILIVELEKKLTSTNNVKTGKI